MYEVKSVFKKIIGLVLFTLGMNQSVWAYSINDVEVVRYGERYLITFNAQIDAPIEQVKEVVYDFEQASKLTPAVKQTEVYRYDDTTARVTAIMRPCVFLFCKTMKKLTIVNLEEDQIHLAGVEDAGSFRNSDELVKFRSVGEGTELRYKGDISPRFYIPSWLGVRYIRSAVRKYLGPLLANIEARANSAGSEDLASS